MPASKKNSTSSDEFAALFDQKLNPISQQIQSISDKLDSFITKDDAMIMIKEATGELSDAVDKLTEKCNSLEDKNKKLYDALKQQQSYIERMDAKERGSNLIVYGVPEGTFERCDADDEKVQLIMGMVNEGNANVNSVKRIGTAEPNKIRPLLLKVSSMSTRNRIVDLARKCTNPLMANIKVRKDLHPSVRKEWKRLFEVKDAEERKPENAGHAITIDMKKREVLRDGDVIDSWNLLF